MASAVMSGIGVTQLRGKFGGSIVQRNANGLFVRNSPIPTQPGTEYQVVQQAVYSQVVGYWSELSEAQRAAWIAFAATPAGEYQNRVGETQNYTGQQLFIKLNLAAYQTSFPIENPPTVPSFTANPVELFRVRVGGGALSEVSAKFTNSLDNSGITIKFYVTFGLSPGISRPRASLFKLIEEVAGNVGGTTVELKDSFATRFGVPTVGTKVFVRVFFTDIASGYEFKNSQSFAIVTELL